METESHQQPQSVTSDLRWYFARTDTRPLKSNYGAMVRRLTMGRRRSEPPAGADDDALEDAARSGSVARVLRALDPETAEVLWRAFGAECPEEFALLGDLSAIVPLTRAATEAYRASKSTMTFENWLRSLVVRKYRSKAASTIERFQEEAQEMRGRAVAAYVATRRKVGSHG